MAMSKLARARQNTANLRKRVKEGEPIRAVSAFAAGMAVGALERNQVVPTTIQGVPVKPAVAALLFAVGASRSPGSPTANALLGAGDGIFGASGYAAGREGSFGISGL